MKRRDKQKTKCFHALFKEEKENQNVEIRKISMCPILCHSNEESQHISIIPQYSFIRFGLKRPVTIQTLNIFSRYKDLPPMRTMKIIYQQSKEIIQKQQPKQHYLGGRGSVYKNCSLEEHTHEMYVFKSYFCKKPLYLQGQFNCFP